MIRHKPPLREDKELIIAYFLFAFTAVAGTIALFLMKQLDFLPTFYLVLIQGALGSLIYLRNRRSEINLSYFLFVLSFIVWSVLSFLVTQRRTPGLMWGDKFIFVPATMFLAFFVHFSLVFPRRNRQLSALQRLAIFAYPLLLIVLIPTSLIISDVVVINGTVTPCFGAAYFLFVIYALSYVILGLYNLVNHFLSSSGLEKLQIRYVFLGMFLSFFCLIFSNLVLPWLGEARLAPYGPLFTVFFVAFTAYAILKHRLMSIEVVIQRSAVYAVSTVLIMALYALAVMVSELYLRRIIGYSSLLVTALAALVIAALYQPMVRNLQSLTDRLFFRWRYDYQKTLSQISRQIASVIRLDELVKLIVTSLLETMKVSELSFLLPAGDRFRSLPLNLPGYKPIEVDLRNPVIARLAATREALVRDEIEDAAVRDAMERLAFSLWLPIVSQRELIGIIALGGKISGEVFTAEDLALLSTLASQTAVALENARLYEEVLTMKNYNEEILHSLTSGVLTTDARGRLVAYNPMAARITGRPAAEVIGRACEEIWGKRGAVTEAVAATLRGHACLNYETGLSSPERGFVPVALSSTVMRDSQGKKSGALLLIQDLTEIKELEDKIRRADKLTALATMAAGMAHEIKNPLSSMKVFSQLLPIKINDPEYRQKLGEILPKEIDRIDRIVESLLGFARSTTLKFSSTPIEEVLEVNLRYFAGKAEENGIRIVRSYFPLPPVEVDQDQLAQVFSNLILNAIQAMPDGGELTVTTAPGKKIDHVLQTIKVSVSDTGHGITEEMQRKLFDPFFTTKYGGTGLGLSISHSIVDSHKGFIDVESQLGKGTTFTVTLPVRQSDLLV